MKKILVLASTYPRWKGDTTPPFVQNLCRELSLDYTVDVLAPHFKGAKKKEVNGGVTVYRYRYAPSSLQLLAYGGGLLDNLKAQRWLIIFLPFFFFSQLFSAIKLLKNNDYDAINAHWIIPQGLVAVLARSLSRKKLPLVMTSHGADLFALDQGPFRVLKQWLLSRCQHLTVVSHAMKKFVLSSYSFPMDKISVNPMGVDLCRFVKPEVAPDRNQIIFVGRLVEKKGVEYLIRAFEMIVNVRPGAHLIIVGGGPLEDSLKQLSSELGISAFVEFTGAVTNEHTIALYQKAEIAVIPSVVESGGNQEGLGLTLVEAMGCGCAVVASDLPAIHDVVINGKTGLLARPRDPEDLAEKIKILMGDSIYRKKLVESASLRIKEEFDWSSVGQGYRGLFAEISNQK